MPRQIIDPIKALMLYERGMHDNDMAGELSVTRAQVKYWRWMRRLPANGLKHGKTPEQTRKIDEMLKTTATDKEIGAAVGLSSDAVRRHRVQRGIPVASVRAGGEPPKRTGHGVREYRIPAARHREPEQGPWTSAGMSRLAYETLAARDAGMSYGAWKSAQAGVSP